MNLRSLLSFEGIMLLCILQFASFSWYYVIFHYVDSNNQIKKISLKTIVLKYLAYMAPMYLYILWKLYKIYHK